MICLLTLPDSLHLATSYMFVSWDKGTMSAGKVISPAVNHAELSCLSLFPHLKSCCNVCLQMARHLGMMTITVMMIVHPVLNSQVSKYLHSSLSRLLSQLLRHHRRKPLSITPCGSPIILLNTCSLCILVPSHQHRSRLPAFLFL